jgi:nucleoside-diphosphate-sugar epimerase
MKILVTGASSLAASRLVPLLIEEGHDVTTTSRRVVHSPRHIACDLSAGANALPDEPFDSVLHFAAYVPQNERASTWEECAPTNVGGTIHLLRWAEGRAKRFVLASSLAVYGGEESNVQPATDYAITKYAQEQLLAAFCVPRALPLTILRLGYVYGPGIADYRAVKKLLQSVRDGQPIRLTAPNADLHLIHTDDVAHIANQLLLTDGTFNVVMSEPVTVRMYVDAAMDVGRRNVDVIEEQDTPTPHYSAEGLLALGIRPRVTLHEGIASL